MAISLENREVGACTLRKKAKACQYCFCIQVCLETIQEGSLPAAHDSEFTKEEEEETKSNSKPSQSHLFKFSGAMQTMNANNLSSIVREKKMKQIPLFTLISKMAWQRNSEVFKVKVHIFTGLYGTPIGLLIIISNQHYCL